MNFGTYTKQKWLSQQNFTLIELIFVISIMMLIVGLSLVSFVRMPAGVVLTNTTAKLEQLMVTAETQASLQGIQRNITFDTEKKIFYITAPKSDQENEEGQDSEQSLPALSSDNSFVVTETVEIEFPDYEEEIVEYRFFPDGSASGPDMLLTLEDHKRLIYLSPLTGVVTVTELE